MDVSKSIGVTLIVACVLGGCQTSGLKTPEAEWLTQVVSLHCAGDREALVKESLAERIEVFSITPVGADGWIKAKVYQNGNALNVYANTQTVELACSDAGWRKGQAEGKFLKGSNDPFKG